MVSVMGEALSRSKKQQPASHVRSVGFFAMSRRSYSVSSVSPGLPAAQIFSKNPQSARLSGGAPTIRYKRYNSAPPRNISGTDWRHNSQEINAMAPVIRSK